MTYRTIVDDALKSAMAAESKSAPYLLEVIRALADELDRRDRLRSRELLTGHFSSSAGATLMGVIGGGRR